MKSLAAERAELPAAIAQLSAEIRRLVESIARLAPTARAVVEARIDELASAVANHETRLREVQRCLANIGKATATRAWVLETIASFEPVWEAMTPANRIRLLQALVERIDVDEPRGEILVTFFGSIHGFDDRREEHRAQERVPG